MTDDKLELLALMAKIPGLRDLNIPIMDLPSEAEFAESLEWMDAKFNADFSKGFDIVLSDVKSAAPGEGFSHPAEEYMSGSQRITIRIPSRVLKALKTRAKSKCIKYQTLINRTLQSAVKEWESSSSHV